MLPPVPGGQGGPRFPGFGVGRGFAIWGPFPVHAPDSAPETWTSLNKNLALHTALPVVDGFAGFGGFVFTHGHFGFQKQRAATVCMILMIFLEARPRAGAIKATPATDLMVFPAVPDHSRPQVRLALSCRPRLGFGSRGLVVRSLRHLPWGSRRQAMKFRRSAAGKSHCRPHSRREGQNCHPNGRRFEPCPDRLGSSPGNTCPMGWDFLNCLFPPCWGGLSPQTPFHGGNRHGLSGYFVYLGHAM